MSRLWQKLPANTPASHYDSVALHYSHMRESPGVGVKILCLGPTHWNFGVIGPGNSLASGVLKSLQTIWICSQGWEPLVSVEAHACGSRDICSKSVHHHHFPLVASYIWGLGVGLGVKESIKMGGMSCSNYSAHPVFVFPNHFLFCFHFLALFSFNKPYLLPTLNSLSSCSPFMIKV